MTTDRPQITFLGLGRMGGRMAGHLLAAGHDLTVFDPDSERLESVVSRGGRAASSTAEAVASADIVMTSLRSSAMFVEIAERDIIPNLRQGSILLDMGTTEAPETRRIAGLVAEKGGMMLDCPVSGSPGPTMRVFVGGDHETFESVLPILQSTSHPNRIVYCGPSGTGQAVKAVNQLGMGLVDAAFVEAVSFGVRAGADIEAIINGVGGNDGWRKRITQVAEMVREERADQILTKYPELPYYLREAAERGFAMPMTAALYEFLRDGEHDLTDNMGRPRVGLWRQLMKRAEK